MLRLTVYLILAIAILTGGTWITTYAGHIVIEWTGSENTGYEISLHTLTALTILAFCILAVIFLWRLFVFLSASPGRIAASLKRRRQHQAETLLAQGLVAVAAGEMVQAGRLADRVATAIKDKTLEKHWHGVAELLQVQAAQTSGDGASTERRGRALLENPETKPAGLRILTLNAIRQGNTTDALEWAQQTQKENPKTLWATRMIFDHHATEGNWKEAEQILNKATRHGLFTRTDIVRRRVVIHTARALEQEQAGARKSALKTAMEAVKLDPEFAPAATLAGRLLTEDGRLKQANSILTAARVAGPSATATHWACGLCGHHADNWHAVCPHCGQFDSLSPQKTSNRPDEKTSTHTKPPPAPEPSPLSDDLRGPPRQPDDPGPTTNPSLLK
ncbi:MAG: heme biosynthesis HemY N-terminal domain-containing protein [Parvularculales bacterium]